MNYSDLTLRRVFVKRPKFLAATSNLRVEQNLVHLGRFLHFSQKVVGLTLSFVLHVCAKRFKFYSTLSV